MDELTENQAQVDEQILENQIEDAAQKAQKAERDRMAALKAEFAEDPEFAMQAFADGLSIEQAKAAYCDVLKERLKERKVEQQTIEGVAAIATEDTDEGSEGDFITAAKELAEEKKISVTEAMKRLARRNPSIHKKFLERCQSEGKQMYAEAV